MVPCNVITKRGAVSRSSSARKVVESDGCHQSGRVRGDEARLKRDRSGEVLGDEDATLPKRGGSDVVKRLMGKTN